MEREEETAETTEEREKKHLNTRNHRCIEKTNRKKKTEKQKQKTFCVCGYYHQYILDKIAIQIVHIFHPLFDSAL
jgi:hypothetical protein